MLTNVLLSLAGATFAAWLLDEILFEDSSDDGEEADPILLTEGESFQGGSEDDLVLLRGGVSSISENETAYLGGGEGNDTLTLELDYLASQAELVPAVLTGGEGNDLFEVMVDGSLSTDADTRVHLATITDFTETEDQLAFLIDPDNGYVSDFEIVPTADGTAVDVVLHTIDDRDVISAQSFVRLEGITSLDPEQIRFDLITSSVTTPDLPDDPSFGTSVYGDAGVVAAPDDSAAVFTGDGEDAIAIATRNALVATSAGSDNVTVTDGFAMVHTGDGADTVVWSSADGGHVALGTGDDMVTLQDGSATVVTGPGDDIVHITRTADSGSEVLLAGGNNTVLMTMGNSVEGMLPTDRIELYIYPEHLTSRAPAVIRASGYGFSGLGTGAGTEITINLPANIVGDLTVEATEAGSSYNPYIQYDFVTADGQVLLSVQAGDIEVPDTTALDLVTIRSFDP